MTVYGYHPIFKKQKLGTTWRICNKTKKFCSPLSKIASWKAIEFSIGGAAATPSSKKHLIEEIKGYCIIAIIKKIK